MKIADRVKGPAALESLSDKVPSLRDTAKLSEHRVILLCLCQGTKDVVTSTTQHEKGFG